jgi:hypothetical protein
MRQSARILEVTAAIIGLSAVWASGCSSSDDNTSLIAHSNGAGGGSSGGSGASSDASPDGRGFFMGTGGSTTTDSGPLPDGACGITKLTAKSLEVNVLLVIDKSGSMADKPTGFTTDKWSALKTALKSSLGAVENSLSFGLELYPLSADPKNPIPVKCSTNCCDMPALPGINVPVAAGSTSVPDILSTLDATPPGGGTPTAEALKRALEYFTTGDGKSLTGDKYVLLATDGGPNCNAQAPQCDESKCTLNLDGNCPIEGSDAGGFQGNCCNANLEGPKLCLDDGETTAQLQNLNKAGIKTFVIGIPGSEAYKTYLDEFAVAGGEENPAAPPKYFAVSASGGVGELTNVLSSITKKLIRSCELKLTSEPRDLGKLNVYVDGNELKRDDANGWKLDTSTSPPTVDLTGSACTEVETKGARSVQVVFGCPSVH